MTKIFSAIAVLGVILAQPAYAGYAAEQPNERPVTVTVDGTDLNLSNPKHRDQLIVRSIAQAREFCSKQDSSKSPCLVEIEVLGLHSGQALQQTFREYNEFRRGGNAG